MQSFSTDEAVGASFGFASSVVALPKPSSGFLGNVGKCVRVVNLGPMHISVKLGGADVTVTSSTGLTILQGGVEYLTLNGATHIAGVSHGGPGNSTMVNLAVGS
jgi:hypothetical protein